MLHEQRGLEPSYEQASFPEHEQQGRLRLVGSRNGYGGPVIIYQGVDLYISLLNEGELEDKQRRGRKGWLQVAQGSVEANAQPRSAGNRAALTDERAVSIGGMEPAEELHF